MKKSRQQDAPSKKVAGLPQKRVIELLLNRFHNIEKKWHHEVSRKKSLAELKEYLKTIPDLPFISRLCKHINENISLPHLCALLVPVEREYSNLNITDDDIIVTSRDTASSAERNIMPVTVILENIRSAFNVGGIFRTSDCFGMEKIILCGYSPTPENVKTQHSAMGTHESVKWSHVKTISTAIRQAKRHGTTIIAMETAVKSQSYYQTEFPFPCVILMGNERFGLTRTALKASDMIVNIPTCGAKNSLNVACAFAICASELRRQWTTKHKKND